MEPRQPWSRREGAKRICLSCLRSTSSHPRDCQRPEHARVFGVRQRYNRAYRERHRARLAVAHRHYIRSRRAEFRRKQREYNRQWYQRNRARKLEQNRRWDRAHHTQRQEYFQRHALEWYYKHHTRALQRARRYYRANRQRKNRQRNEQLKRQRRRDPGARIRMQLRSRLSTLVRQGGEKAFSISKEVMLYSAEELRQHLERLFLPKMSWSNYGRKGWHVDHIIPCDNFNLSVLAEARECFALHNLRPLWAADNLSRFHTERRKHPQKSAPSAHSDEFGH